MKVLIVKTSSMGDVIHTLPALTDAQKALPNIRFDWVAEENFVEIPRWHTAVNETIPVALRRWRKNLCRRRTWTEWRNYLKRLRAERYDAVIDAQGLIKSALFVTRPAKGKKYGYGRHSAREGFSSLFYDEKFDTPYQQHAVERIRKLFAAALGYEMPAGPGDYGIAQNFAKNAENPTACQPYMVVVHATTRADKHWKEEYWAELLKKSALQGMYVRLPWGNETEKRRAERLAEVSSNIQVLPKLTLSGLASQIANAKLVVSVDTGLSHLAAALDKPNIILYGATDPMLIGAYGKNQHYLTAENMAEISPCRVLQALENVLERQAE